MKTAKRLYFFVIVPAIVWALVGLVVFSFRCPYIPRNMTVLHYLPQVVTFKRVSFEEYESDAREFQ